MFNLIRLILQRAGALVLKLMQRPFIVKLILKFPFLHRYINKFIINRLATVARTRPHPFSTQSPYSSWSSLTDKTWSGRHLPASKVDPTKLPLWKGDKGLRIIFEREEGEQRLCPKSTLLFATFAQYLTDGFIRTVPEKHPITGIADENNRKRNTSNHDIDMCPLYGRHVEQTRALRVNNPSDSERGKLKSQCFNGEEYPPFLFSNGVLDPSFSELDPPLGLREILENSDGNEPLVSKAANILRDNLFAVGGDRVNSAPQISLMNTLWLREHNRLANELGFQNTTWSDDQVFETARNIVIAQFIKIVVEDYINHIAPIAIPLTADASIAWNARWNKPNWITTEISLLYRWHALIPDTIRWGEHAYAMGDGYLMNNKPFLDSGLQKAFEDLSNQKAAQIGPRNTNETLLDIEEASIRQGRICELASYNEYRKYLGAKPIEHFSEISTDPVVVEQLENAYDSVDDIDFFVGIFSEDRMKNSPLPPTILSFVALDAFTQALTNPLLSEHMSAAKSEFDNPTFSNYGKNQIDSCSSIKDIVARNVLNPDSLGFVGMTQEHWHPE